MGKKTTKTEEAAVGSGQAAPLTWTVSDDMMSITLSDGRKGKAVKVDETGCERCMFDKSFCSVESGFGDKFDVKTLCCIKSIRRASPLSENIVWVEDVAAPTTEDAEKFYTENKDSMGDAVPPVGLDKVEAIERPDGSLEPRVESIALNLIDQSPYQIRVVDTDSEAFKELVASVQAQGLINPITVRFIEATGRYELIAGHRRFAACEMIGMLVAPCYLLKVSDRKAEDMTCCENLNREDLLPIDEALTVKAMLDHGRTREEIAKITGKSTRWVYRREAAARIGSEWIQLARTHKLSSKFLELLGNIDEASREQALLSINRQANILEDCGRVQLLRQQVGYYNRDLCYAPWKDDFSDWCAECPKRSDKCQGIEDDGNSPWCMDSACWDRNTKAYPDALIERYRDQGVEIKELSAESDIELMDLSPDRDEDYDVCVVRRETEDKEFEMYWARSKPIKASKDKKQTEERRATEQNIFEKAYAEEVLFCIEEIVADEPDNKYGNSHDFKHFTAAAIACGMDLVAPRHAPSWQSPKRVSDCCSWLIENDCKTEAIFEALRSCVLAKAANNLRIYNPLDTANSYLCAQTYVLAFNLDKHEVEEAARARIPKNGKSKRK